MKNISFEITGLDIRNYLMQHKNDEIIKNREAMFVKYMKENNKITQESLEILMKKYNLENTCIYELFRSDENGKMLSNLPSFYPYISSGIKNLDVSGICHIMIPCIKYYGHGDFRYNVYLNIVNSIIEELEIGQYDELSAILLDALDNYMVAEQIDDLKNIHNGYSKITMSKYKSEKLIYTYYHIYGVEPVKQIRKMIRERV